jgi:hypothetical protein
MTTHKFVHQDVLIVPFTANADRLISTHPTRNLFGAPIPLQLVLDHLPCFQLDTHSPVVATRDGQKMGLPGSIPSLATITKKLTADGRFMASSTLAISGHYDPFSTRHISGIVVPGYAVCSL